MSEEYVTSETNLPPEPEGKEITLQISDKDTREIFNTRARISRNPDALTDPAPLTVVKGPHENKEEKWYIEILTADIESESVDRELLRTTLKEVKDDANIINTRSDEVKTLLRYLVKTGQYSSVSQASRTIMFEYLADTHPELVDEYVDLRVKLEHQELLDTNQEKHDG
jgi:hypothetical protein